MDKNNLENAQQAARLLKEINEREKQPKRRKALIQSQKPWYQNPTNTIGLLTIATTIAITLFSLFYNSKKIEPN